jgi:hypothetical protein
VSGHTSQVSQTEDSALEEEYTVDERAGTSAQDTSMAEATGDETDRSKAGLENIEKSKTREGDGGMVDVCAKCGRYWRPKLNLNSTKTGKIRDEASVLKTRQREYQLLRTSMHSVGALLHTNIHMHTQVKSSSYIPSHIHTCVRYAESGKYTLCQALYTNTHIHT